MPIPKSTTKKIRALMENGEQRHIKKPDLDNIVKAFTDALNGIAYADDSLITGINAQKKYGDPVGISMVISEDVN